MPSLPKIPPVHQAPPAVTLERLEDRRRAGSDQGSRRKRINDWRDRTLTGTGLA